MLFSETKRERKLFSYFQFKAQILSQEFKEISASERAKWDQKALQDKERYAREMEDYVPPDDMEEEVLGKSSKRKKKDPNAPKRNMSAYFLYSNHIRPSVKEENPDASFGEVAKIISRQYKALSEKELDVFKRKAEEDKERYQDAMKVYKGE